MYKIRKSLTEEKQSEKKSDLIFTLVLLIIVLIMAVFVLLNIYVFGCIVVSGRSMQPTLNNGDILIMNRIKEPKHFDVVIISGERAGGDWLIKRVIGKGGDTVKLKDGFVYLKKAGEEDFTKLEEKYLREEGITYYPEVSGRKLNLNGTVFTEEFEMVIPEGEIYFLGDNRTDSKDSRSDFSTCKTEQIVGVVPQRVIDDKQTVGKICKVFFAIKKFLGGDMAEVSD